MDANNNHTTADTVHHSVTTKQRCSPESRFFFSLLCVAMTSATLTTRPVSVVVKVGARVILSCRTAMTIEPIYWAFRPSDGHSVRKSIYHGRGTEMGQRLSVNTTTPGQSDLMIETVELTDAGFYECKDSEGFGEAARAQLVVLHALPICNASLLNVTKGGEQEEEVMRSGCNKTTFAKINNDLKNSHIFKNVDKRGASSGQRERIGVPLREGLEDEHGRHRNKKITTANVNNLKNVDIAVDNVERRELNSDDDDDVLDTGEMFTDSDETEVFVVRLTCSVSYFGNLSTDIKWTQGDESVIRELTNDADIVQTSCKLGEFKIATRLDLFVNNLTEVIRKLISSQTLWEKSAVGSELTSENAFLDTMPDLRAVIDISPYVRTCWINFAFTQRHSVGQNDSFLGMHHDAHDAYTFNWSSRHDVSVILTNHMRQIAAASAVKQRLNLNSSSASNSKNFLEATTSHVHADAVNWIIILFVVIVVVIGGILLPVYWRRCLLKSSTKQVNATTESAAYNIHSNSTFTRPNSIRTPTQLQHTDNNYDTTAYISPNSIMAPTRLNSNNNDDNTAYLRLHDSILGYSNDIWRTPSSLIFDGEASINPRSSVISSETARLLHEYLDVCESPPRIASKTQQGEGLQGDSVQGEDYEEIGMRNLRTCGIDNYWGGSDEGEENREVDIIEGGDVNKGKK